MPTQIAVAHDISPFVSAYPWSAAGFGTKLTDEVERRMNTRASGLGL